MRLEQLTTAKVALIAAILAFTSNVLPWIIKALGRRRLETRRLSLEAVRQDTDRLDSSYKRLETENVRLWGRVTSLETAIGIERDSHELTRRRCNDLETMIRGMGHQLPSAEDGPDEDGGSR